MLACDLLMEVRASRTITAEQVKQLDRLVFGAGCPSRDQLDLIFLIDTYLDRPDPRWAELFASAALAALPAVAGQSRSLSA
jgi:hypothetical protein